ncbi:MAG: M64 family metallopeptidase, partial [Planctomycetota bacterium]
LTISSRNSDNSFHIILDRVLPLAEMNVRNDNPYRHLKRVELMENGEPENKVDIVILGDGYAEDEMDRYISDARDAMKELFSEDPFKEHQERFNVWAVESPSPESGVDEPRKGFYKATFFDTSFNTFNLDRYAMTSSIKTLRDVAACVPYDFIIIIFNSSRYGGGGIYNLYAMVTGNHARRGVLPHEMGHCMAALGDEYVDSSVAYIDFFPEGVEPWEPNLTALINGAPPKWASMIPEDTPIPTPAKRGFFETVGCFEGAGYKPEGLYRPSFDCIMRSCKNGFCPICRNALMETIRFYTE